MVFGAHEMALLHEICEDDPLAFELTRELLDVERRYHTSSRRAGLYDAFEQAFRRNFYADKQDATERARRRRDALSKVQIMIEDQNLAHYPLFPSQEDADGAVDTSQRLGEP